MSRQVEPIAKRANPVRVKIGPDFLCVGMQKAGTGWIYDALVATDGFQMMPLKEFHHFDMEARNKLGSRAHIKRYGKPLAKHVKRVGALQVERFEIAREAYVNRPSFDTYRAMFIADPGMITGDLTPAYSTLPADRVAEVKRRLPSAKTILSIREPRARAWSQFNMVLRNFMKWRGINAYKDQAKRIDQLASPSLLWTFTKTPGFRSRAFPSAIFQTWVAKYQDLLVVDFTKITQEPREAFAQIVDYLGHPYAPVPKLRNKKAKDPKAKRLPAHDAILNTVFSREIKECRRLLPDITENWH